MTTIRKIVTSQVDGNSANESSTGEIRPFGETGFFIDTNGNTNKLVLSMFEGQRTHLRSKVLSPGVFYGSNADSGDGLGYDTIKLIPDASLHFNDSNYGNDQYLIIDPTAPNHIHIRAGGTIDSSNADLFLGGEQNHVKISDGSDTVTVRTSQEGEGVVNRDWVFDNNGALTFPSGGAIESVGMGWTGLTNGVTGNPLSIIYKTSNVSYAGETLSEINFFNGDDDTQGRVWISTHDRAAENYNQWTFDYDGKLVLPGTAEITDTPVITEAGTIITVSLNAAGDTEDYVGGASLIEIPKDVGTNQVQAGWIITFLANDVQRTVSGVIDGGSYWAVTYNEANPGLGSSTYPLTIQSADYVAASLGITALTKGTNSWQFYSNGLLELPEGAQIDNNDGVFEVRNSGNVNFETQNTFNIVTDSQNSGHSWQFGDDGSLSLPGGEVSLYVDGMGGPTDFNISIPEPITGSAVFRFTTEGGPGELVFPDGTRQSTAWAGGRVVSVPTHSTGAVGDTEGDLAFSNGYIYYCTADYGQIGHQIVVATLYNGGTVINSNTLQLTKTADTLQITVGDIISDSDGGATSVVGIVSHDDNYTYVNTGVGGGIAYNCVFPLTFTSTDYVSGGNIWKRIAWSGDTW